jgi:hypothetical protein
LAFELKTGKKSLYRLALDLQADAARPKAVFSLNLGIIYACSALFMGRNQLLKI